MLKKHIIILCCLFLFPLCGDEFLQKKDIHKIIEQILQQQGKQDLTPTILKRAFEINLEQFDPEKRYFLSSEFQSFTDLSSFDLNKLAADSKKGLYHEFEAIQKTIEKAIAKSRLIRQSLYAKKGQLLEEARDAPSLIPSFKSYAKDDQELALRMNQLLIFFIAHERQKGATNLDSILTSFEKKLESFENTYLGVNEKGLPLPTQEKENLFVLHVLKSLAKSLDAHTDFYSSQEAYDMRTRLEKETQGIGVLVAPGEDGALIIQKLIPGGPAQRSGLVKEQDRIIEVNEKNVFKEPSSQIIDLLRGKKDGSEIRLKIQRDVDGAAKTLAVTLNTEEIQIKEGRVDISSYETPEGLIGRIALHSFYQGESEGLNSATDVKNAISELSKEKPLKGLILDLRDNYGGFLTQAVKVGGLFISNGVIVVSKYFSGEQHVYRDLDNTETYSGPLVVLISKLTASAAEIVAQTLQDYGVALIVGDEHSFGKGTIQSQTVTGQGASSYFKVTVGKYYTVSGKTPQLGGVKADIVVPGKYSSDKLGEEYLDHPLPQDSIQETYQDPLQGVDPSLKTWYLRYYVPTLQKSVNQWRDVLPVLRKNNQKRIENNARYQQLLDLERKSPQQSSQWGSEIDDLQLQETVHVVQDMIRLKK